MSVCGELPPHSLENSLPLCELLLLCPLLQPRVPLFARSRSRLRELGRLLRAAAESPNDELSASSRDEKDCDLEA